MPRLFRIFIQRIRTRGASDAVYAMRPLIWAYERWLEYERERIAAPDRMPLRTPGDWLHEADWRYAKAVYDRFQHYKEK